MIRLLIAWSCVCLSGLASANDRPNILFIAVDDLRPELSCYGREHMHSPNMDRLAASGVLLERAYCMVPTCGASRASLMTGLRPTRQRFVNYLTRADADAPGITTLNTHFQNHGFHTASLGKVFHHLNDNVDGWTTKPWRGRGGIAYHDPENQKLHVRMQRQGSRKRGPAWESADADEESYRDAILANKAVEELKRLSKETEPFFLAVGFYKPHLPFVAPKKYWDLYDTDEIELPENYHIPTDAPAVSIHNSGELRAYAGIPATGPVTDDQAKKLIHGYYACVSFTDAQIGKLLDTLDELGITENTIVVLWGDHGWNLGEHTLWCKHSCYETSMRIPLVVRAPGITAGQRLDSIVETVDLYPTLCDFAGIPKPDHLQGDSLVPLLRGTETGWQNWAIGRYRNGDTVRTDQYRYSEYTQANGREQGRMLYDHRSDPRENQNIFEPGSELAEQLSQQLARGRTYGSVEINEEEQP